MNLKKVFSGLTLFGFFSLGAILLIGKVSANNFIYVFTPFMAIISILFFVMVKDYLTLRSDKVLLCVLLILLSFFLTFTIAGFKDFADALQTDNPLIDAQIKQNNELSKANNYNLQVAQSMQEALTKYQTKSVELNGELNTLLKKGGTIDQPAIQEEPVFKRREREDNEDDEEDDD